VNNNVLDLSALSDRALIALQFGLTQLWEIEVQERNNAFYPEIGETTSRDLDLVDAINEELYERGNGGHRFCRNHLLPLIAPDGCERCAGIESLINAMNNNNESEV